MSDAPALVIPRPIHDQMISHALADAPLECCGLLGGVGGRVETFHPLRNADSSQTRYSADPADLISAVRSIRAAGAEVVAIYHSHPRWAAIPSRTDLAENFWGDVPRPIISLLDDPPTMRVWRLRPDSYDELAWRVV
jgi:proteasome lid subunit RPN8/RPN11